MSKSTVMAWVPALACVAWALMLAWWFWDYLVAILRRPSGESVRDALARVAAERKLDKAAREQMFGSRRITGIASLASSVASLVMLTALSRGSPLGFFMGVYLVLGLLVLLRYRLRSHASWSRLTFGSRLWFRLTHAWLWPAHLLFNREGTRRDANAAHPTDSKD